MTNDNLATPEYIKAARPHLEHYDVDVQKMRDAYEQMKSAAYGWVADDPGKTWPKYRLDFINGMYKEMKDKTITSEQYEDIGRAFYSCLMALAEEGRLIAEPRLKNGKIGVKSLFWPAHQDS